MESRQFKDIISLLKAKERIVGPASGHAATTAQTSRSRMGLQRYTSNEKSDIFAWITLMLAFAPLLYSIFKI